MGSFFGEPNKDLWWAKKDLPTLHLYFHRKIYSKKFPKRLAKFIAIKLSFGVQTFRFGTLESKPSDLALWSPNLQIWHFGVQTFRFGNVAFLILWYYYTYPN